MKRFALIVLLSWLFSCAAANAQGTIPQGFPQDTVSGVLGTESILTLTVPSSGDLVNARVLSPTARFIVTDNGPHGSYILELATVDLAHGGTNATTQQGALDNIMPTTPALGDLVKYNGTHWVRLPVGTANQVLAVNAGGTDEAWSTTAASAPLGSAYITVGSDATLTAERAITAGSGITGTDGGANSTFTIAVDTAVVATTSNTLTMSNKTLTSPIFAWNGGAGVTLNGSVRTVALKWTDWTAGNLGTITFPDVANTAATVIYDINAQTITGVKTFNSATLKLAGNNLVTSAGSNATLATTGADTIVEEGATETLTNKTLTSPAVGTQITLNQATANYVITWDNPGSAGNRAYHINDINSPGAFVLYDGATASYTGGKICYMDGTGLTALANGNSGQVLQSNGGTAAPSWAAAGITFGGNGSDGAVNIGSSVGYSVPKIWYATTWTSGAFTSNGVDFTICATSSVSGSSGSVTTAGFGGAGGLAELTASEKGRQGAGPAPGEGGDQDFLAANPGGGGGGGSVTASGGGGGATGGGAGGSVTSTSSFIGVRSGSGGGSGATGASGSSGNGGNGGGSVRIYAAGAITYSGTISSAGSTGGGGTTLAGGSGGGGGGSIFAFSQTSITTSANWTAAGGAGGAGVGTASGGGGGGGGGLVYIMSPANTTTAGPVVTGGSAGTGVGAGGSTGNAGIFSINTQTPTLPTIVFVDDMRGLVAQLNLQRGRKWLAQGMKEISRVDGRQHENVTWQAAWYAAPGKFDSLCYMLNWGGDPNKAVALADNVFKFKSATNQHTIYGTLADCKADPACFDAFPPEQVEETCIGDYSELQPAA